MIESKMIEVLETRCNQIREFQKNSGEGKLGGFLADLEWVIAQLRARVWIAVDVATPVRPGFYEVTVDTDDGEEVLILQYDKSGHWIYEGEPTYAHGFYIAVKFWRPRADPVALATQGEE